MLSPISSFCPSLGLSTTAIPKFGMLAITALTLQAISKIPGANAMDETGLKVCMNICRQKYSGVRLDQCIQEYWKAYIQVC